MQKNKFGIIFLAFLVFSLAGLLLRENQRANAAEAKLEDVQSKLNTINDEKDSVINDLQFQMTTLKGKLDDSEAALKALGEQKDAEIARLNSEAEAKAEEQKTQLADKVNELAQLETQSKTDTEKFNALLAEKNTQIQTLTKKTQELEAKNLESESRINELNRTVSKLNAHNERLAEVVKNSQTHKAAID